VLEYQPSTRSVSTLPTMHIKRNPKQPLPTWTLEKRFAHELTTAFYPETEEEWDATTVAFEEDIADMGDFDTQGTIHQIFLKVRNKYFGEFPTFVESSNAWKKWCKENNMEYKLWTEEELKSLRYETAELFQRLDMENRDPFVKVDFLRPVILKCHGGCYVDLDTFPTGDFKSLYDNNETIIGSWVDKYGKAHLNNNVLKLGEGLAREIQYHFEEQIEIKSKMKIYDTWKIRYIFQTCGPKSLKRFCDKKKITFTPNLHKYISDKETQSWLMK